MRVSGLLSRLFTVVVLLCLPFMASAKTWLAPEIVDDSGAASAVHNIAAATSQPGNNLYVVWENGMGSMAPHASNLFTRMRFRSSLTWTDTRQLTSHMPGPDSGAQYPQMGVNSGWAGGDNVYLTYSAAGRGYVFQAVSSGTEEVLDTGHCGSAGNGAVIAMEDPINYHVLYLKCPERQLFYRKFTETPADHGWSSARAVTTTGNVIFSYDMVADTDHNLHAVWSESFSGSGGERARLYYLKYTEGSGWAATPELLAESNSISGVQIGVDPSGQVHVVWSDLEPEEALAPEILYRMRDGARWSPAVSVSAGDAHAGNPSLVVTRDANVHVAWVSGDLRLLYRKKKDVEWGVPRQLSDPGVSHPYLVADIMDNLYLFYAAPGGDSPTDRRLEMRRFADPSAHTPTGADVRVDLNGHSVTIHEVTRDGVTTIRSLGSGSPPGPDYALSCSPASYFEIDSTALYRGPVDICLSYDGEACSEVDLRLLHNLGDRWEDITTSVDTDDNLICGRVWFSMSEYVLAQPAGSAPPPFSGYPLLALAALAVISMIVWGIRRRRP